jgi:hypothetical protein
LNVKNNQEVMKMLVRNLGPTRRMLLESFSDGRRDSLANFQLELCRSSFGRAVDTPHAQILIN